MADLRITDLAKAFGTVQVLRRVSLHVASGELMAILGASGSGKTTLLRLICGFDHADSGSIAVDGQLFADRNLHVPTERRRIGYVAQEGALFPHLSVAENITFGLPRSARRNRARVDELLEMVGLPSHFGDRPPQALSGGEQQRVALARALAPAPKVVLLDEPFSALDAALRAETRGAVAAALANAGATAVLVTHDQAEALSIGHQVAVLREGRLVQAADPMTLYRLPTDVSLAKFVGEAVVLRGEVSGGRVRCALGTCNVARPPPNGVADVVIRPEQIRLTMNGEPAAVRARVTNVVFYGHDARIDLRLVGPSEQPELFARTAGHQIPPPGAEVGVQVEGDVLAFPVGFDASTD
jgi:iron(III) transport system ATP-binding protein